MGTYRKPTAPRPARIKPIGTFKVPKLKPMTVPKGGSFKPKR